MLLAFSVQFCFPMCLLPSLFVLLFRFFLCLECLDLVASLGLHLSSAFRFFSDSDLSLASEALRVCFLPLFRQLFFLCFFRFFLPVD